MKIAPMDWEKFQHYKDRAPPWIKLHKGLLNNPKWHRLQLDSRALAPLLWLLASEAKDGIIDEAIEDAAFRLRCAPEELDSAVKDLIANGFFINLESSASTVLAPRPQVAVPETEGETEERERQSKSAAEASAKPGAAPTQRAGPDLPSWLPVSAWNAWLEVRRKKRAPPTAEALSLNLRNLEKWRAKGYDPEEIINYSIANGYTGLFEPKHAPRKLAQEKTHEPRPTIEAI